ncbi:hypothetical protein [Lacticaseibacillus zhaodongensis]|uniref:hypothetical protein n=1 Tax=Lacticaseibacillus zhaodongensis TaxID=2668065 RepID=UPI0012D36723|nr:hypothetical protein [Lacticaseibacillus zhaodongensis]
MFVLFLGITLRFTLLAIIVALLGCWQLLRQGKHKRVRMDLLLNVLLFIVATMWIYVVLPEPSIATTVLGNLGTLTISALIQALLTSKFKLPNVALNFGKLGGKHDGQTKAKTDVTPGQHRRLSFAAITGWSLALFVIAMVVFAVAGMTDAKKIASSAPVVTHNSTSNAPLPVVDAKSQQVPVVNTPATVLTQINNSLSNIPNANVYEVKHVRAQVYRRKMVYVAPLDFDGSFLRYMRYRKVDGYFMTDATSKTARPHFVKRALRYTPQAYFGKDARRLMYAHTAQSSYVLMSNAPQLEVDDKGTPYYVSTLVKRYGMTNRQDFRDKAVVTLNAETGTVHFYKRLAAKPKWLDVAVDPNTAGAQVNSWGTERNGWWNANGIGGGQQGVMVAVGGAGTEGEDNELTPVLYKGQIYYQQSLTSAKSSQTSVMGFIFTDAASGKSYYYREEKDAMTPDRAQRLAKDMMKQTGWKPKMPLLYRIDGRPTWIVSMLDSSDAFRSYVYMLASGNGTSSTVATGDDAQSALSKYRTLFGGGLNASATNGKKKHVSGTILRTSRAGDTMSFLLAAGQTVYSISVKEYPLAQFIREGDSVSFTARVSGQNATVVSPIKDAQLPAK